MLTQMTVRSTLIHSLDRADSVEPYAQRLFDRAVWEFRRRKLGAALLGHQRRLLVLNDLLADVSIDHRHDVGTRTVALDQIRGSVDKADDFDVDFYPAQEHTENRWVHVATAFLRGTPLPPVELILAGETYFVVDGHHRISVARMLKHTHIAAVVTVWELSSMNS